MNIYALLWLKAAVLRRRLVTYWWSSVYTVYLRCHPAVRRMGRVRITGRIKWRLHPAAVVEFGDRIRINSGAGVNAVGGHRCCVIAVLAGGQLRIGSRSGISSSTIVCQERIDIGSDVLIGGDCSIYDGDFHPLVHAVRVERPHQPGETKPTKIGDGCFLGAHAILLKGANIGARAVVGAGSVVAGTIPPDEVWGGNPARAIRSLEVDRQHDRGSR